MPGNDAVEFDVLVIDDEAAFCELVESVAEVAGLDCRRIEAAADYRPALTDAARVVVLDLSMPELTGPAVMAEMGERGCTTPIVLMSGFDTTVLEASASRGRRLGANVVGTLGKPVRAAALLEALRDAIDA